MPLCALRAPDGRVEDVGVLGSVSGPTIRVGRFRLSGIRV